MLMKIFKIAEQMGRTNWDFGEKCIRDDHDHGDGKITAKQGV